jgi:Family of unknown function (DUF6338)
LLPGFVSAWVYFSLTAHKKPSSFERIIQAFIFTAFVLPVRWAIMSLALLIGQYMAIGTWTKDTGLFWGVLIALVVGLIASWITNTSTLHKFLSSDKLKSLRVTKRTSYPSEWFSAFNYDKRYILLHLKDKRKLYGWPEEFPDHCDTGHFILRNAAWVWPDRKRVSLHNIERLVVPVEMVMLVEFQRWDNEVTASKEELDEMNQQLTKLEELWLKVEEKSDAKPGEAENDGQSTAKTDSAVHAAAE